RLYAIRTLSVSSCTGIGHTSLLGGFSNTSCQSLRSRNRAGTSLILTAQSARRTNLAEEKDRGGCSAIAKNTCQARSRRLGPTSLLLKARKHNIVLSKHSLNSKKEIRSR